MRVQRQESESSSGAGSRAGVDRHAAVEDVAAHHAPYHHEMLEPGGRYAAMDLYVEPGRGPMSRALDFGYRVVARADHSRRFWQPLQRQCTEYEERVFPFLGERVLVVSGTRPVGG